MLMFQFPNGPMIGKNDQITITRPSNRKWWQFWKPRYTVVVTYGVLSVNTIDRAGVAVID